MLKNINVPVKIPMRKEKVLTSETLKTTSSGSSEAKYKLSGSGKQASVSWMFEYINTPLPTN